MAKKAKFTYTHTDGRVDTRQSATNAYTHVVIGRRNLGRAREQAVARRENQTALSNYKFFKQQAVAGAGGFIQLRNGPLAVSQGEFERAAAVMARCPTIDHYYDECLTNEITRINMFGTGDFGPFEVLQWSMSAANAHKGASRWIGYGWADVHVDETDQVKAGEAAAEEAAHYEQLERGYAQDRI